MAELGELAEGLGDVVAEGGEGIGATTTEELGDMVEQLADESSLEEKAAASEEGVADALQEGQSEMMQEIKTGTLESIKNKMNQFLRYMWDSKAAFAKMMGAEIAKGALFTVGMKAIEAIWAHMVKKDPNPVNQRALAVVKAIVAERKQTNPILKGWQLWMSKHFDNRDNYGSIPAEGIDISIYQILQNKISQARQFGDSCYKEIQKVAKQNNLDGIDAVLSDEKKYLDKLIDANSSIESKGVKMVADGLQLHTDDLDNAKKSLDI